MAQEYLNKKAQLSEHFHWIFILVAGAIILLFFVSIVVKQKDISEQNIAGKALTGLDQIFTAAGVTEDTLNKIEIPKVQMEFICSDEYSEFNILKTGLNRNLFSELVFSPDLVKGNEIYIWTIPWKMPYAVDNFIMITSPEVRYIILYDSASEYKAAVIFDDLPDLLTKELYDLSQLGSLEPAGNYKAKFVFVTDDDISSYNLPELADEISAVQIADGFVRFYSHDDGALLSNYAADNFFVMNEQQKSQLLGDEKDAMMYSAVFAENSEMYRCGIKKAYSRLNLVSKVYKNKVSALEQFYKTLPSPSCTGWYEPKDFDSIISYSSQCASNPAENCFNSLLQKTTVVATANELIKTTDCPLIY